MLRAWPQSFSFLQKFVSLLAIMSTCFRPRIARICTRTISTKLEATVTVVTAHYRHHERDRTGHKNAFNWRREYHGQILSKFQAQPHTLRYLRQVIQSTLTSSHCGVCGETELLDSGDRSLVACEVYHGAKVQEVQKHRLVTLFPKSEEIRCDADVGSAQRLDTIMVEW